jgi:hypothetical protein
MRSPSAPFIAVHRDFHAPPSSTGEYHNPPITNAETAAAITAR